VFFENVSDGLTFICFSGFAKEIKQFEEFLEYIKFDKLNPPTLYSELRAFSEKYMIAGTADFILSTGTPGEFDMYDFKRVDKNCSPDVFAFGKMGSRGLSDVEDTKHNRYSIQLYLYKFLFENELGMKIRRLFIVQMHPAFSTFKMTEASDMTTEIKIILDARIADLKDKTLNE